MIDGRASANSKPLAGSKATPASRQAAAVKVNQQKTATNKAASGRMSAQAPRSNGPQSADSAARRPSAGPKSAASEQQAAKVKQNQQQTRTNTAASGRLGAQAAAARPGQLTAPSGGFTTADASDRASRTATIQKSNKGQIAADQKAGLTPKGYQGTAEEQAMNNFNTTGKSAEEINNTRTGRGWVIAGRAIQAGQDWSGANRQLGLKAPLPGDKGFTSANIPKNVPNRDMTQPGLASAGRMSAQAPKLAPQQIASGTTQQAVAQRNAASSTLASSTVQPINKPKQDMIEKKLA